MPRRKKEVSAGIEPPKKRAKVSPPVDLDASTVQWEWEGDKGVWTAFAEDFNEEITEAFTSGQKEVTLTVPGSAQIRVIFEKMVQKNKKTGWERRLRLCLKDSDDFYAWEWVDEHKRWNPYDALVCLDLENALEASSTSIGIVASHRSYTVDVTKMEQSNDETSVVRKIHREKTDSKQPPRVNPKPSTSASKSPSSNGKSARESGGASASTSKSGRSAGTKSQAAKSAAKDTVKTVVVKGKAPVDPECPKASVSHVFCEGKDIYDAMLNQTNLSNNNNKYYLCQLLEDDNKKSYSVWFRWGRVGKNGQNALIPCGPNLEEAKSTFCKKFYDKTRNDWALKSSFEKVPGKYDLVEIDYNINDDKNDGVDDVDSKSGAGDVPVPDSKLDKKLQTLINLICDVKSMEDAVVEMKYDARKAPLGKLKTTQIKAGYVALKKMEACIDKGDFGTKLIQACDEFYTRIPHDFGMARPPVIRTKAELKLKISLLEALSDIEIAMNILKHSTSTENPIDTHYKDLKCEIKPVTKGDGDYDMVEDYLQNTHAPTHNQYKMEIQDLFEVVKEGDADRFIDHGNRMLLWHGSRLTNWMGILSQGLRIAPPEAPVTGYMFGKGVYFADMSSKSANYCYPTRAKNTGLLLLCEVSLGKTNELLAADYKAASLPAGKHSVWGKGKVAPDPAKNFKTDDDCLVPLGKPKDTGVSNPSGYTLNYNEFIVYDVNQIRLKYLVKVKFNFK